MDTPVYEYTITKQDYQQAQQLHRRHVPRAAWNYWGWYRVLPGLAAAYVLYVFMLWPTEGYYSFLRRAPEGAFALYLALALPLLLWWWRRRAWNNVQPKHRAGKPVTVQFDDTYIVSAVPGVSDGRFYWTGIVDYAEDDRLALVYVRPKLFLFVPKRAMPEDEWQRLRTLALPYQRARH